MLCKSSPVNSTVMNRVQDIHLATLSKTHERYICHFNAPDVLFIQSTRDRTRGPGGKVTFDLGL